MVLLNPFTTHMHTRSSLISSLSSGPTHAAFPLAEPSELSILGRVRISNHQVWNCGFVFVCAYIFHQFISFLRPENFLTSDIFRVHFFPFFACLCVRVHLFVLMYVFVCVCAGRTDGTGLRDTVWGETSPTELLLACARAHTHICKDQSLISLS